MYSRYLAEYKPFEPLDNCLTRPKSNEEPLPHLIPAAEEKRSEIKKQSPLSGLFKKFTGSWDSGDILLLLIILFLFSEGDDMELLIILGLALFM